MSTIESPLKNEEEEKNTLTGETTGESTGVEVKPAEELTETAEVFSETKVRHDTVK